MGIESQTTILNRHSFKKSFTAEFDANQSAAELLAPSSGKTLKITGISIITEASAGGVRLYFGDDEEDQVNTVYKLFAATNPATGYIPLSLKGDRDAPLLMDTDLGPSENYFILVNYSEE